MATKKKVVRKLKSKRPTVKKLKAKTLKVNVRLFPSSELKHFHKLLLQRRAKIAGVAEQLEGSVLKRSMQEASGDLSSQPLHMADLGTDEFEESLTIGLAEDKEKELSEIDEALERIKDKSYGACENCSKPISKERLKIIPHARLCIKCKEKEESS